MLAIQYSECENKPKKCVFKKIRSGISFASKITVFA